jgi:glycine cleavage system transcriptional repressor
LTEGTGQLGLAIWVQPIVDVGAPQQAGNRWLVSVYGADRPGIVFEVTRELARAGINITDLQTRLLDRVCALSMEVTVPAGADGNQVADQLDRLANQLGMACSMRPKPEQPRT